jgi:two-component system LytT family sensor kinase
MPTLLWIAVTTVAIATGLYADAAPDVPGGVGRLFPRVPGPPPDLRTLLHQLGVGSVDWYTAALALPFMIWGARRLEAERYGWPRIVGIALAIVAVLVAATSITDYFIVYQGAPSRPSAASYLTVALRQNVLPWIALAAIAAAVEGRRRTLRSMVERERLRAQVAEQRLIALTGQLHPHFLFNTLQGVSTLIHRDAAAADEMLNKLSDLLRELLRHRDRVLVPLEDELRYARTYLEIAKLRFTDRLAFVIDVPSELDQCLVPLFILQPLVENALTHGIGARIRGGRIALTASRRGDRLSVEVADDGAGLSTGLQGTTPPDRIGLANTRERLRASFGDDQHFSLSPGPDGGAIARIDIPLRPGAPERPPT